MKGEGAGSVLLGPALPLNSCARVSPSQQERPIVLRTLGSGGPQAG